MTLLVMKLVSLGQTRAFAGKSPARQALEQGQEALGSGNIAGARAGFQKAVRLAPNDAEAQSQLGLTLIEPRHKDEATQEFQKARALDPHLAVPGKEEERKQ